MPEIEIPRDRYGRPLITPAGGGTPVPYTRVSTLAKTLDDKTALAKWMCQQTAIGMSTRPDLVSLVAASRDNKTVLAEAVEQAMSAAKSNEAANLGTTLHALTESWDRDQYDPQYVSPTMHEDVRAYAVATEHLKVEAIEVFVAADEVQSAGTFDRVVRLPDGRLMVADIKTGQHEPKYPSGVTTQIAVYAHGTPYQPPGDRGAALAELGISQTEGMLIHLPAGKAQCDLYVLDLRVGWALAQVAHSVRAMQKSKIIVPYSPS